MSASRSLTGRTTVLGVIGWPIEHSLSPTMHNAEFDRLGLDFVYVPFPVPPENLETAVRGLAAAGLAGFNVTIPHKQSVIACLDEISEDAQLIGAVNTVKLENGRSTGYNTDVQGWVDDIQQDILLKGSTMCLLGSGGAARALCVGAAQAGVRSIFICNRTIERAQQLSAELRDRFPEVDFTTGSVEDPDNRAFFQQSDIIVNATPVGMPTSPGMPVPAEWIRENQYVYDTIYTPAETELLRTAVRRGCNTRGGLGMLARQGALAFELWTGLQPDVSRMESTLRRALSL